MFLSPVGLVILSALDTSMVFFLPTAVEAAELVLIARNRELVWLFPLLAALGSLIGAFITLSIGARIGEEGLSRWLPEKKFQALRQKVGNKGAVPLATAGLMPPPFPLSIFVLACGALGVKRSMFLYAFGLARLVRFAIVATFGFFYGNWILRVIQSDTFQALVMVFIGIVIAGSALSIYRFTRNARVREEFEGR